tara:strand:- start:615 stop:1685 length:1071 start_codon:yes stop_codon:yes gene_type:complete
MKFFSIQNFKQFITPSYKPSIKDRILGLDELRGIAVLFVLFDHGQLIFYDGPRVEFLNTLGYFWVDLFFIISGFLIAKILISKKGEIGFFRNFYVRRIFRIWPLMYVFIILGVLLCYVGPVSNDAPFTVLPYYIFFAQNFIVPFEIGLPLPGTSPFWSLAIEEQFYLFLPIIVRYVPVKKLSYLILFIFSFSLIARLNFMNGQEYGFYYTNLKETYFRVHFIALGVLIALPNYKTNVLIALIIWLLGYVVYAPDNGLLELPLAIIVCVLIVFSINKRPVFRSTILAHFGKICFGLYVIHYSIAKFLSVFSLSSTIHMKWGFFIVFLLISYCMALISFHFIEIPTQNLRTKFEKSKK